MNSTLMLLNWFWWRYRLMLVGSLLLLLLGQLVYWSGVLLDVDRMDPWVVLLHASAFAAFGAVLTAFSHGADLDLTSGKSSLPRWLHYLPARNHTLSVVPILALLIIFTCVWIPYVLTAMHYVDSQISSTIPNRGLTLEKLHFFVFIPWLFICALGMWVQATSWLPFKFAAIRLVVLFGAVYGMFSAIVKITDVSEEVEHYNSWTQAVMAERGWELSALAIGSFAFCALAAVWSVSHARQRLTFAESEWSGNFWARLSAVAKNFKNAVSPESNLVATPFASDTQAIRWRDWSRLGQFPCWAILLLSIWLVYCEFGMALFPISILVCAFCGTLLGKNKYWKGYKPFSPFLGTLPVSDGTFLRMRYANAFRVSITCWGITGAAFLVWFLKMESRGLLQSIATAFSHVLGSEMGESPYGFNLLLALLLLSLVLIVIAPIPGMMVGLSGRRYIHLTFNIAAAFIGVASLVGLLALLSRVTARLGSAEFVNHPELKQVYLDALFNRIFLLLGLVVIVKLLLAGAAIWLQVSRGIFRWQPILKYGALLLLVSAVLVAVFWLLLHKTDYHFRWLPMLIVILCPFVSMLLAPVSLDWNRHR